MTKPKLMKLLSIRKLKQIGTTKPQGAPLQTLADLPKAACILQFAKVKVTRKTWVGEDLMLQQNFSINYLLLAIWSVGNFQSQKVKVFKV